MRLRSATPEDRALLEHWDRQPHVTAAGGDDDFFDWQAELPRGLPWRELLLAEIDDRPIGFIQIIDPQAEETHYWGEVGAGLRAIDIWIGEASDLGREYGSKMMQLALDRCFAEPAVEAVLVDPLAANHRAHRFYERLGFSRIERRLFDGDDCWVYRIDRQDWHPPASG